VLPILKDMLSCEARQAAALTLGQIALDKEKGPALNVLAALFKGLGDNSAQVRLACIQSLTWLGAPGDPKAKADLIAALQPLAAKDPEPTVQLWAHMAIMSVTHDIGPEHITPICKMMEHLEVPVRVQAAQALGTIGPKAKAAIPVLIQGLTDKDPGVIMVCIWALGRMEDNATLALPHLERITKDNDMPEVIQNTAKEAIKQISGKKK
jgi:HEAT repeat protein